MALPEDRPDRTPSRPAAGPSAHLCCYRRKAAAPVHLHLGPLLTQRLL